MKLELLITQVAEGLGYELLDLEVSPRGRLIRVFIDAERPITLEDCERVSNQLQRVFEVEGVDYDRLEVSSPGLDRVLKKAHHFARFVGERAQVRLASPVGGRRHFAGVIAAVEGEEVTLWLDDGQRVQFPVTAVERARLVPRFS
ncbi:MAG: ribosome maturation factor RimP [Hydrogenophilus sp.]|nr:ribosome maturation factor RimP [Hydrogenophilus sp.]